MSLRDKIEELIKDQKLAVLGTSNGALPHTTLVAFSANLEESTALFVTPSSSRKAQNIENNPYASLLIDNRGNNVLDFRDACVITMKGKVDKAIKSDHIDFLSKHPHLVNFLKSPSTTLYKIRLEKVELVTNFQNIYELDLNE